MPPAADTAQPPVGLRRGAHYLPELESLRGLAIVLVYAFHIEGMLRTAPPTDVSLLEAYVYGGNTGVGLFFVLSGFLLALPFLAEADGGPGVNRRRYFERRALRILPLYYLVVLVAAAATASRLGDLTRALPYLVFANSVHGWTTHMPPWTNVLWSLSTEAQFYLLLPLLPLALRSPRGRRVGLALLLLYVAAYVCFVFVPPKVHWSHVLRLGSSVFGRGWLFLGGIGAAWIHLHHGTRLRDRLAASALWRHGGADAALVAILALFAILLRSMLGYRAMRAEHPPAVVWHVGEAVAWTLVLLAVLLAPLRLKPLFSNPILTRIGVLSYSIYLLHVPVLRGLLRVSYTPIMASMTSRAIGVALLTALVLGVSALSYRFIEQPFLVRKARLDT